MDRINPKALKALKGGATIIISMMITAGIFLCVYAFFYIGKFDSDQQNEETKIAFGLNWIFYGLGLLLYCLWLTWNHLTLERHIGKCMALTLDILIVLIIIAICINATPWL